MAGRGPASAELLLPQHPTSLNTVQLRWSYRSCYFWRCYFVAATNPLPYRARTLNKRGCPAVFKLTEHTLSLTHTPPSPSVTESTRCLSLGRKNWRTLQGCLSLPGLVSSPPLTVPPPPSRRPSAGVDLGGSAHPPGLPHVGPPALPPPGRG